MGSEGVTGGSRYERRRRDGAGGGEEEKDGVEG